jgi:hypothetical protein
MLEARKTAVALEEGELIELARIIIDRDEKEALRFLKKSVYDKVLRSQKGRLKCHLDTGSESPVEIFKKHR